MKNIKDLFAENDPKLINHELYTQPKIEIQISPVIRQKSLPKHV